MKQGFTLIEALLAVSIIAAMAGISTPLLSSFVARNDLDLTTQNVIRALHRAQLYARSGVGDSPWGVAILSDKAVLFKGATYASRDANFDENILFSNITPSTLAEVGFTELTGTPTTTGNTTLTANGTTNTRTITVNAKGMVE